MFFSPSSFHSFATVTNTQPCRRVVSFELIFEVHPHCAEKSVSETSSVANLKTITGSLHNLEFPEGEFNVTFLSPGEFNLKVHRSACATS